MTPKTWQVVEQQEVFFDYVNITQYIIENTKDRALANRTVDAIRAYIASMSVVLHRGTQRDDLRPGLRIVPFKKRTAIAFEIDEDKEVVKILRVFYGGQDYAAVLNSTRQRKPNVNANRAGTRAFFNSP